MLTIADSLLEFFWHFAIHSCVEVKCLDMGEGIQKGFLGGPRISHTHFLKRVYDIRSVHIAPHTHVMQLLFQSHIFPLVLIDLLPQSTSQVNLRLANIHFLIHFIISLLTWFLTFRVFYRLKHPLLVKCSDFIHHSQDKVLSTAENLQKTVELSFGEQLSELDKGKGIDELTPV